MTQSERTHHRIYRSNTNKIITGVCGGIAEHFDFNATGVRVLFALFTLGTGIFWGAIIYAVLSIVMKPAPVESFRNLGEEDFWNTYHSSRSVALQKVQQRFEALDRRLQNMESIVTSPTFGMEEELRNL